MQAEYTFSCVGDLFGEFRSVMRRYRPTLDQHWAKKQSASSLYFEMTIPNPSQEFHWKTESHCPVRLNMFSGCVYTLDFHEINFTFPHGYLASQPGDWRWARLGKSATGWQNIGHMVRPTPPLCTFLILHIWDSEGQIDGSWIPSVWVHMCAHDGNFQWKLIEKTWQMFELIIMMSQQASPNQFSAAASLPFQKRDSFSSPDHVGTWQDMHTVIKVKVQIE